jgi:ribulose 1,5-bisphosphate synthetase/thiazole synthase
MGLFFSKLFVKENTANNLVDINIDDEEEEDYTISVKYRYIYGDVPTITSTVCTAPARVSTKNSVNKE